jgi:hypothetical protein
MPRELETRICYDVDTGVLDPNSICDVPVDTVWTEAYITVDSGFAPKQAHIVQNGKLCTIDTSIHVYHKPAHGVLVNNNPYFCSQAIEE